MDLNRWKLKNKEVVYEIWFHQDKKHKLEEGEHKGFLIFCHGCPSHPFDHNPAPVKQFLSEGYMLVYPRYIGTWESTGRCNLENTVETVRVVNQGLKEEECEELRTGQTVEWRYKKPILVGASFGGSVVLVAGAKMDDIQTIISVCPVIDFEKHNNAGYNEENLDKTWEAIKKGWENLWRIQKSDWNKLKRGDLDLNPSDYISELSDKKTMIIHGKKDNSVDYNKSKKFHEKLKRNNKGSHRILLVEEEVHMGTFKLGDSSIYRNVLNFIE